MLRQNELAFMKAISTLQVTPALVMELWLAMAQRKKKPAVPAGTSGSGTRATHQLTGKRNANDLGSSGNSMEPDNRCPAPGAGSLTLPAKSSVTGAQSARGRQQHDPSVVGAT